MDNEIIKPIVGITIRFANNAITDNFPKYNNVNGSVPICAAKDTAIKSKKNLISLDSILSLFIALEISGYITPIARTAENES